MNDVLIGLGGNLGDVEATIARACMLLCSDIFEPRLSRMYQTAPVYDKPGAVVPEIAAPAYTNAVLRAKTYWEPEPFLRRLLDVEHILGRVRPAPECSPRSIDLDLLLYGDYVMTSSVEGGLILPHPRMHQRRFVLEPACDVAPEWVHPVLNQSLKTLLDAL